MYPQAPNIVSVSAAIVLLANMFLNTNLVTEQVQSVIGAAMVLIFAGASVWSWFKTRGLIKENIELTASLSAARAIARASAKTKK